MPAPITALNEAASAAESAPQPAPIRETVLGVEEESSFSNSRSSILPCSDGLDIYVSPTEPRSVQETEFLRQKKRECDEHATSESESQTFVPPEVFESPVLSQQKIGERQSTAYERGHDVPRLPVVTTESSVKSIQDSWILEVFAGTANLVAAAATAGMKRSLGLDHARMPQRKGKVIQLDLSLDSHQGLLWKWLDSPGLVTVWIAPPLGEANSQSRHHDYEQTSNLASHSLEYPKGGPVPVQRELVCTLSAQIFKACQARDIPAVIENPYNSPLWHAPQIASLLEQGDAFLVRSDLCMFGGHRFQSSALLSNSSLVQSLAAQCDGRHKHLALGQDSEGLGSRQESAYPHNFCRTFMLALTASLKDFGWADETEVQELKGPGPAGAKVLTTQARTKRAASFRVIPEFRKSLRCSLAEAERAHLVTPTWTSAEKFRAWHAGEAEEVKIVPVPGSSTDVWMHVPWTPPEFAKQARRAGHPAHLHLGIPPQLKQAIDKNSSMTPLQIMHLRAAQSQRWITRARELEAAEATFKQSLPPHIRASLKSKRILLFKEMLEAAHYPDKAVADDMASGFHLVGHLDLPAGWAPDFRPAAISEADLSALSQDGNQQVIREVASSSSFTEELWQKSIEEVSKGWSEGPFSFDELPERAIISKRFAIQQGKKVRPIDDLSQSFLNSAFGSEGKIQLHDTETIAAALLLFLRRHGSGLLGKTIDLKSAYRQLPLSSEALAMSFIAVKNPETGQVQFFRLLCLPFGAVAAVHAFIRVSLALCHLGQTFWLLPWSAFYDDFTLLSTKALCSSSEKSAAFLLDLLGFDFDRDGDKAQPFRSIFRALGVEFNLQDQEGRSFQVANTKERTEELARDLGELASKDRICPKAWNKIRGRLHFVSGQLAGRVPKRLMRRISDVVASLTRWKPEVKEEVSNLLRQLQDYVVESKPRTLRAHTSETLYLFTDASQEGARGQQMGLGAVLLNQEGRILAWFGVLLPEHLATALTSGKTKVINELESLTVLLSFTLCKHLLQERHVMSYIDNEAARVTLLRMSSESQALTLLAGACAVLEDQLAMVPWYGRVPSRSNIADKPSRLNFHGLPPEARIQDDRVTEQAGDIVRCIQGALMPDSY